MNKRYSQFSIVALVMLFLLGVWVLHPLEKKPPVSSSQICYVTPQESATITYNNEKYYKIRDISAISTEQFKWHIKKLPDKIAHKGKDRDTYMPKDRCEAADVLLQDFGPEHSQYQLYKAACDFDTQSSIPLAASVSFGDGQEPDPQAMDLLFVDVSDEVPASRKSTGYLYTDIYLKSLNGQPPEVPGFIKTFCES